MAGPEGFDPSLIEAEALLKKMKPRPANLSAARIVYEAGRAVGKEEAQAYLVNGAMAATALEAAAWKKWVVPAWAGGATTLCLLLLAFNMLRGPQTPHQPEYVDQNPNVYRSPGYRGTIPPQYADQNRPTPPTEAEREAEKMIVPVGGTKNGLPASSAISENQSGSIREGRDEAPEKKRERNFADYIREQLPALESKRNIDPIEIRDGMLQPPSAKMALTTMGMIQVP